MIIIAGYWRYRAFNLVELISLKIINLLARNIRSKHTLKGLPGCIQLDKKLSLENIFGHPI